MSSRSETESFSSDESTKAEPIQNNPLWSPEKVVFFVPSNPDPAQPRQIHEIEPQNNYKPHSNNESVDGELLGCFMCPFQAKAANIIGVHLAEAHKELFNPFRRPKVEFKNVNETGTVVSDKENEKMVNSNALNRSMRKDVNRQNDNTPSYVNIENGQIKEEKQDLLALIVSRDMCSWFILSKVYPSVFSAILFWLIAVA